MKIKIKGTRLNLAARELKGSFERRRYNVNFNEYWIHSIVPIKVSKYSLLPPLVVFSLSHILCVSALLSEKPRTG